MVSFKQPAVCEVQKKEITCTLNNIVNEKRTYYVITLTISNNEIFQ